MNYYDYTKVPEKVNADIRDIAEVLADVGYKGEYSEISDLYRLVKNKNIKECIKPLQGAILECMQSNEHFYMTSAFYSTITEIYMSLSWVIHWRKKAIDRFIEDFLPEDYPIDKYIGISGMDELNIPLKDKMLKLIFSEDGFGAVSLQVYGDGEILDD